MDLAKAYLLLHKSEHWTEKQIADYQAHALSKLLLWCGLQVPHYQAHLAGKRINAGNAFEVLSRLPILDKETVRALPGQFLARDARRFRPRAMSTSGTTGTSLTVYWDRGSNVMEFCSIQRLWRWAGIRIGQQFLDIRSRVLHDSDRYLVKENGIRYIRNRKIGQTDFSSDLINDRNIAIYHDVLLRFNPRLVRGHPQAITDLAELLREHGLDGWRPDAVTTASEALHSFQRRAILQGWRVPILDSYGLMEHNVFIAQCLEGSYHVFPEYGILEILDDDGRPVRKGEEGWIVATGLHSYAQPLLRYNTLDRAVAGDGRCCACGRTLPTIERLVGRKDDLIYASNGKHYSGFHLVFYDRPGLKMARLVQEDLDSVTVEVVADLEFDKEVRRSLVKDLERKVEDAIRFEIRPVERIERDKQGKFKFVISHLEYKPPVSQGELISQ